LITDVLEMQTIGSARGSHSSVVCWTKGTQEQHAEPFFSGSITHVGKSDKHWKVDFW